MIKTLFEYSLVVLFALSLTNVYGQSPDHLNVRERPILLMNATAHLGNGEVIENSAIAFENGKITLVGDARVMRLDLSRFDVIDVYGKHVYPGIILPNTDLRSYEIGKIRPALDFAAEDYITPDIRWLDTFEPDVEVIATLRNNGILLAQVTPRGVGFTGNSSVIMLDEWNGQYPAYVEDDGVHLQWPSKILDAPRQTQDVSGQEIPDYHDQVSLIMNFMEEARAYSQNPKAVDPRMEAMKGIFDGNQRLFIHADGRDEIMESILSMIDFKIDQMVLVGATEALACTSLIKKHDIPVLLDTSHRPFNSEEEDIHPGELLMSLHNEGILIGLYSSSPQEARNLPFFARGETYGLNKEDALRLVTSNTAKILGIDQLTGTLEEGKDANIVVSKGELLDVQSSDVVYAFIRGEAAALRDKQ